jgi:hypothetical protein
VGAGYHGQIFTTTEREPMSEKQRKKIMDVMHTLMCIREGKVHDAEFSAYACWRVLDEVLKLEAKSE